MNLPVVRFLLLAMLLPATVATAQDVSVKALAKPGNKTTRIYTDTNAYRRPIIVNGKRYTDGLVAKGPARIVITLPEDHTFTTFTTKVGVERYSVEQTGVSFEVFADGQRQQRTRMVQRSEAPATLHVDVRGKRKIELIGWQAIRHEQRTTFAAWLEPRLTRGPAPKQTDARVYQDRSVQEHLFFKTRINGRRDRRPYYLSLPAPLDELKAKGKRFPMLVFLHGIAEGGDDHRNLFIEAIPQYLRERPAYIDRYPFIFVCPQAPWQTRFSRDDVRDYVIELIEHLRDTLPVDQDRIYLTGLSDGGIGTWAVAQKRPDLFAAIAPIAARSYSPQTAGKTLRNVPAWIVVGGRDERVLPEARHMRDSYKRAGATYRYKVIPGMGHVIWNQAYLDPALYDWLLQWKRGGKREPYTGLLRNDRDPHRLAAAADLSKANAALKAGDVVEAYRIFESIKLSYPDTIAAKMADITMTTMQRDAEVARKLAKEADEISAAQMLATARQYEAEGKKELAHRTFKLVIDTWPMSRAAWEARAAIGTPKQQPN